MTDADLIYNALLRAERRAETTRDILKAQDAADAPLGVGLWLAVMLIREEIGNGLAQREKDHTHEQ